MAAQSARRADGVLDRVAGCLDEESIYKGPFALRAMHSPTNSLVVNSFVMDIHHAEIDPPLCDVTVLAVLQSSVCLGTANHNYVNAAGFAEVAA